MKLMTEQFVPRSRTPRCGMCEVCDEIDKRIDEAARSLKATIDPAEVDRLYVLIGELYRERIRLHKSPRK
jgi:hypothetical protein